MINLHTVKMVALEQIRSSNSKIATTLPPGLVAVFAGATSGIGETSLKQFVKNAVRPKVYFIGRSMESGRRITEELKTLNSEGEYIFKSVDVSLLRSVDDACREIKNKESAINLLFLSTGTMLSGKDTEEGLLYPVAVSYYARIRFIMNLLPLLQNGTGLRRVVTVLAGTKEGTIDANNLQGRGSSMLALQGQFSSMITFALEAIAKKAPNVSFVHTFPGFVKTNLGNDLKGPVVTVLKIVFAVLFPLIGPFIATPLKETGERQLFFATSSRFPAPTDSTASGTPLPDGVTVARGTNGVSGSGVYSVSKDGETASQKVEQLLRNLRNDGIPEKVWSDVEGEFVRITGTLSV